MNPDAPVRRQRLDRYLVRVGLLVCATYLPLLVLQAWPLTGHGFDMPMFAVFAIIPPVLGTLAIPAAVLTLPGVLLCRWRLPALRLFGFLLVIGLVAYGSIRAGHAARRAAFRLAAERAEPLVAAIENFEHANGRPPRSLDSLVPTYLDQLPTGLPDLELRIPPAPGSDTSSTWILTASTSSGGINFDRFIYYPAQDYPTEDSGGWYERIGTWAYYHE